MRHENTYIKTMCSRLRPLRSLVALTRKRSTDYSEFIGNSTMLGESISPDR